eukprot:COSAG03_NODE_5235_length_1303_cov_1.389535_2_plen_190_part_00
MHSHTQIPRMPYACDSEARRVLSRLSVAQCAHQGLRRYRQLPVRVPIHRLVECCVWPESDVKVVVRFSQTRSCCRQGMSVTGAVDLLVEDSLFELTGGTAPMCGVDVRPFCVGFHYHILDMSPMKIMYMCCVLTECGADVVGWHWTVRLAVTVRTRHQCQLDAEYYFPSLPNAKQLRVWIRARSVPSPQ